MSCFDISFWGHAHNTTFFDWLQSIMSHIDLLLLFWWHALDVVILDRYINQIAYQKCKRRKSNISLRFVNNVAYSKHLNKLQPKLVFVG